MKRFFQKINFKQLAVSENRQQVLRANTSLMMIGFP